MVSQGRFAASGPDRRQQQLRRLFIGRNLQRLLGSSQCTVLVAYFILHFRVRNQGTCERQTRFVAIKLICLLQLANRAVDVALFHQSLSQVKAGTKMARVCGQCIVEETNGIIPLMSIEIVASDLIETISDWFNPI